MVAVRYATDLGGEQFITTVTEIKIIQLKKPVLFY
jgi:hypothetical protein